MSDHDKHDHKNEPGRSVAALFQSRAEARAAVSALHKAKYTHTWMGTTSIAETSTGDAAVTVETGGFFSGTESLVDALVKQGVLGDTARALEARVEPGNAVVTVDPKDKATSEVLSIIEMHGGRTLTGSSASWTAWPSPGLLPDFVGEENYAEETFARR
jgi:hypothetical protein